jgi:hypothetical protein
VFLVFKDHKDDKEHRGFREQWVVKELLAPQEIPA